MKLSLRYLSAALLCVSCVSGTAEEDLSKTSSFTLPGVPVALPSATVDQSLPIDVHDTLSKLKDYGSISFAVNENSLSSDNTLGFIHHMKITIASNDGSMPEETLSDTDVVQSNNKLNFPIVMSSDTLFSYLSNGKCFLHFYVTGNIPTTETNVTHTLSVHVQDSVSKSAL
jgi:hypothetical protein